MAKSHNKKKSRFRKGVTGDTSNLNVNYKILSISHKGEVNIKI